jgi:pimeloyl-[acyl-carrier protein] methyl ester esterase
LADDRDNPRMSALCILPGLDGTTRMLTSFVSATRTAGFDAVYAIGYPTGRVLDYAQLERIARDALPRGTPFILLGESFSGSVAIAIAANPPPNLIGLVLSTTFARPCLCFLRSRR